MKKLVSLAALAAILAGCTNAQNSSSATYGSDGFGEETLVAEGSEQSLNNTYLMAAAPKYYIGNAYKVEDVQENMLSIYDGSDVTVDNTTMNSIRDQIDAISQATTISYNELLETEDYRDLMAKSMGRLQRTSWFLSTLSKCSDSAITGALKNILNFKRS